MLKRMLFALAPLALCLTGSVHAEDDLLSAVKVFDGEAQAETAAPPVDKLGQADVDALLGDDENDEEAIAACYRRVGFGWGGGYRNFGYRSYSFSYHRPVSYGYGFGYNRFPRYYSPVVSCYTPVYRSYWGCW